MHGSFYGWYFKCQSDTHTLAVIPAVHGTGRNATCSIQIITEDDTWTVTYPGKTFRRKGNTIRIGNNRFGEKGIRLAINTPELKVKGKLNFGPLSPLKYNIMGPFSMVPFMECCHGVWSMKHWVSGKVYIDGREYAFRNALGYWEGDRGKSFPEQYLWTQCFFPGGSLMLSVAEIPMAGIHFTGIIGVVLWKGKEYRFATYLGARIIERGNGKAWITQGKLELEVRLLEVLSKPLKAPTEGDMVRTIHESAACKAFYRFRQDGRTLFAFETDQASFEYEYKN